MPKLRAIDDNETYRAIAEAAYRRGRSGFSVKDEQDAAKYKKVWKDQAIEIMGQTGSVVKTPADAESAVGNAEAQWKHNLTTPRGRAINAENQAFGEAELAAVQAKRFARNAKKP